MQLPDSWQEHGHRCDGCNLFLPKQWTYWEEGDHEGYAMWAEQTCAHCGTKNRITLRQDAREWHRAGYGEPRR